MNGPGYGNMFDDCGGWGSTKKTISLKNDELYVSEEIIKDIGWN